MGWRAPLVYWDLQQVVPVWRLESQLDACLRRAGGEPRQGVFVTSSLSSLSRQQHPLGLILPEH